jgi:ribosomal-protein-serine acetyltransferase
MPSLRIDNDILLRILEPQDAETLFALIERNRLFLRQWLPWVDTNKTKEQSEVFIRSSQDQYRLNLGFQCGIWYREMLAGIIGFHNFDWMNRNAEIGYWIGEEFQGNGIMTKACRMLVIYAFYDLKLHRIQIRCATGNTKSNAIIERLGFMQEGTTRQAEFLYDHYVDLYVYGMTIDGWIEMHGQLAEKIEWSK